MGQFLVTGANSGIGLATVLELADRGHKVVGTVRSEAKATSLRAEVAARGGNVETRILDVTDAEGCAGVIGELELDGLVNNAGYGLTGAVEDVSDDDARDLLETMLIAPARLARLAVPAMRERGHGRIVMVSSIYGRTTTPLTGWYQAAKHGLEGLSDALRMEVARDGIQVILVEPGQFETGIWDDHKADVEAHAASTYAPSYRRTETLLRTFSPLMGNPAECAKVIATALTAKVTRPRYLVGVDARLLSGSALVPAQVRDLVSRKVLGL